MSAKAPNLSWASPYVTVKDVDAALDFYQKAFKFSVHGDLMKGDDDTTWHAAMKYQDQTIMFGKSGAYNNDCESPVMNNVVSPMNLYVYVDDVDSFHEHAVAAGAESMQAPDDTFWGDRMCVLVDPEGYRWYFATFNG